MPAIVWAAEAFAAWALGSAAVTATFIAVSTVASIGIAWGLSRVINGNPNKGNNSASQSQGGRVQVPPATNNKIPVVYGNAYINGIITDARLITLEQKKNDVMYYCIVLSETCNDPTAQYTIDDLYWNDLRLVPLETSGGESHVIKEGKKTVDGPGEDFTDNNFIVETNQNLMIRVYAGGSTAADQIWPPQAAGNNANAYNFWGSSPIDPNGDGSWTSAHEMKGLVFAIVRVRWNAEKGFTGLPNMTFKINNSINNPADVWYDYMTSERYGAGIPTTAINSTAKLAWKNFCDEDISYTDKDGNINQATTRYGINGPIDTSRSVKENIDVIMQNGGAWLSYDVASGLWSPIIKKAVTAGEVGLPATYFTASRSGTTLTVTNFPAGRIEVGQKLYTSAGTLLGTIDAQLTPTAGETAGQKGRYTTSGSGVVASTTMYTLPASMLRFSDDNIISGITISSTRLDDLYNKVEVEFYDKYNKDQKAYFRNEIDAGERNPNEPDNQLRLSLDLCNNSMQADILGQLELRQSRDDLVIEFTSNHYGIQTQAGDVISVYSDLYDWAPKYFRVMRVKEIEGEDGGLMANIQALEYSPDVYTVEPITEFSTSANIGIGVFGASQNLPQPPVVRVVEIDTDVPIPNFQLQIQIPTDGGPFDEIELYYTEGWDPMSISGSVVPGTGTNGAPVGDGLLTVTAVDYGAINVGDYFVIGTTSFTITEQLTNNPVSKTFASGGAPFTTTVTLNDTTGLKIGNNLIGTGLPTSGAHITAIAGSQVTLDTPFSIQAAGTYAVFGGLGTYIVDTSASLTGTTTLYDLPINSDYKYLKKVTPEGNNATFTNGETITVIITEVPANTQIYRRWFMKARMGIKKRFGSFSTPTITDKNGNFRYTPNPVASGRLTDLSDVLITDPAEGETLYYDTATNQWKNNSILKINDSATGVEIYNTAGTRVRRTETTTNTTITALTVSGATTGTTAAGFGTAIALENEISPDTYTVGAYITSKLTDVTPGSEDADLTFVLQTAGGVTTPLTLSGSNAFTNGHFRTSLNNTLTPRGIGGVTAANDYWFIGGYDTQGTGNNNGAVVIASGNNGNEPIYVRQYTGPANPTTTEFPGTNTFVNELTLLDASGNTTIPGTLILNGDRTIQVPNAAPNEVLSIKADICGWVPNSTATGSPYMSWDATEGILSIETSTYSTDGDITPSGLSVRNVTTLNNDIVRPLRLVTNPTSAPTVGSGTGIEFTVSFDTPAIESALLEVVMTDATAGSNDFEYSLSLRQNGTLTEVTTISSQGDIETTGYVKTRVYSVSQLPTASLALQGARAFVDDCSTAVFNAVVTSGGSNLVPVFCTGFQWRVG